MGRRLPIRKVYRQQQRQCQPQKRVDVPRQWCSMSSVTTSATTSHPQHYQKIITEEGVVLFQADAESMTSGSGQGLVWGSRLWPSGISLAKYLAANEQQASRKYRHVLELGCGTGLVGLTAAKLGICQRVTLTDFESSLFPLLRQSIEANGLDLIKSGDSESYIGSGTRNQSTRIKLHGLDWRDPSTFFMPPCPHYDEAVDLVVAADVLYNGMDKLFARALASHLLSREELRQQQDQAQQQQQTRKAGIHALLACPFRTDSPLATFFQTCERLGLAFERLQDEAGNAAGAAAGLDPASVAFTNTYFVPLDTNEQRQTVATRPTFSSQNANKVQIFRVRRVEGTAESSASIRRVSRL